MHSDTDNFYVSGTLIARPQRRHRGRAAMGRDDLPRDLSQSCERLQTRRATRRVRAIVRSLGNRAASRRRSFLTEMWERFTYYGDALHPRSSSPWRAVERRRPRARRPRRERDLRPCINRRDLRLRPVWRAGWRDHRLPGAQAGSDRRWRPDPLCGNALLILRSVRVAFLRRPSWSSCSAWAS